MSAPVAFVTGAARGIGAAVAAELERRGFRVVRNDLQKPADVVGDISKDPERIAAEAFAAHGNVHCLVNNAGVQVRSRGDMLDVTPESFDRLVGVNLRGTFFLTQAIARRMVAAQADGQFRSIVTVSSANAVMASINRAEYCLSKSALSMMVKLYALRLAEAGIRCYEIRPGIIRTDMTAPVAERYERQIADGLTPIRRWGEAEDVARTVGMLASGEHGFSTGDALHVDGGLQVHTL